MFSVFGELYILHLNELVFRQPETNYKAESYILLMVSNVCINIKYATNMIQKDSKRYSTYQCL